MAVTKCLFALWLDNFWTNCSDHIHVLNVETCCITPSCGSLKNVISERSSNLDHCFPNFFVHRPLLSLKNNCRSVRPYSPKCRISRWQVIYFSEVIIHALCVQCTFFTLAPKKNALYWTVTIWVYIEFCPIGY
jgi:hypothetical protein